MSVTLDSLPDRVVAELVASILASEPAQRLTLITSLDARVRTAALTQLFDTAVLPDDARLVDPIKASLLPSVGCVSALLLNAERYGPFVRRLSISDPLFFASVDKPPNTLLQFDTEDVGRDEKIPTNASGVGPLPAFVLSRVISACVNLEEFVWLSSTSPPDGICEILGSCNTKLVSCSFTPPSMLLSHTSPARLVLPRWDAPSLPHLSALPLSSLRINRLSQQGARSLSVLFAKISEYSNLEDISLDFLWLDDQLCDSLVLAGRKLKRLQLATSGTKLTDRGIITILEGCDALEELSLADVQGRLSRSLWSKITGLPPSLHTLRVSFSEAGPHHSWTTDHLVSISALSMDTITRLSIVRSIHPYDTHLDDVAALKPVPRDVLDKLRDSNSVRILECDWWAWRPFDLKEVLEDNPDLEEVSITFDAPFSKLFALGNVFANMLQLRRLRVSITPRYAPGVPTGASLLLHQQQQPLTGSMSLTTLGSSPVTVTHGFGNRNESSPLSKSSTLSLPASSNSGQPLQTPPQTPSDLSIPLGSSLPSTSPLTSITALPPPTPAILTDPSLPPARDVLKFARRCPKLERIDWYGRHARGSWLVHRDPFPVSSSLNSVRLDFIPPPIASPDVLDRTARERDAQMWGWTPTIPRLGHEWSRSAAEAHTLTVENEKEAASSAVVAAIAESTTANTPIASATAATTSMPTSGSQSSPRKKPPALTPISTSSSSTAACGGGSGSNLGRRKQSGSSVSTLSPTRNTGTSPSASRSGEAKRGDGKDKPNGTASSTSMSSGTVSAVSGVPLKPDRKYYKTDAVRSKSSANPGAGGTKNNGNVSGNGAGNGTGSKKLSMPGVGSIASRNRTRKTSTDVNVGRDASGAGSRGGPRRESKVST
ncbi:hypothetical protein BS47DRAFT_1489049 [Hydnum rufescens UP504]|uniref:Uncharacterized protein n=1 Tax=Hydnum rufescens UP504 TaxID=1448309 RepID=A0A9P6AJQ2_9AGAM|nr:hypothetical protein BS47DRAFT_1489049 [Hydnum rufescens UP504]